MLMDTSSSADDSDSDAESFDYSLEISGENLEDLLAYDDLFLDYFNAFLALPVFPQALVYNRLTGAFEEVDDGGPMEQPPTSYGATDAEREKMLEWARQERLPMFLKTQLFRELKLVKLLLRPLEERQSASRGSSRNLRGYSRQTETYVSSLSNSVDNSAHGALDDDDLWGELHYSALYRYQRPGSRALSVPIKCIHDDQAYDEEESDDYYYVSRKTGSSAGKSQQRMTSTAGAKSAADKRTSTEKRAARISSKVEVIPPASKSGKTRSSQYTKGPPASSTEEMFKKGARALSAPITYAHFLSMPPPMDFADFDAMFGEEEPEPTGQAYVTFEDDHVSDEQTETDVRNMEGRFKMTVQQMKEHILCSRVGFEQFREFIRDTSGCVLLDFWLDCENFKDTMEDFDELKQGEIASMLYRDIQDKYKLKLTQDAKEQIVRSTSNMTLSHTIFLRTQYDVLRRLRAYWLPRFLTHCERTDTLDLEAKEQETPTATRVLRPLRPSRPQVALFPTISLVNSMPVLPEEARNFSFSKTRGTDGRTSSLGRSASSVPARSHHKGSNRQSWRRRTLSSAPISNYSRQSLLSRSTKDRFLLSLTQDRMAGGPFQRYLSKRLGDEQLLSCLLFWQDVTEYGATEDRSADRLLRLCHAWNIYNKFLSEDSPHKVEISEQDRLNLHKTLQSARDFIEASVFDTAKVLAVTKLEKAWVRFLKEDLKAFLDCRVRVGGESPPSTAEAIEITVTDQDVLIKRPRPWVRRLQPIRIPGSAASERARRLQKALLLAEDIDDERRAQKRKKRKEKRKEMERERRKAIRAAYARQREAKKKVSVTNEKPKSAEGGGVEEAADTVDTGGEEEKEKKGVTYQDLSANRQVMSMFRKYLTEHENNKDVQNLMHLYQEIEAYWNSKDSKQKKESMAAHIFKTYLDPQSKKYTQTNERIGQRLNAEKERPKSGTLREIQRFVLPRVEETFKEFLAHQAGELGVSPQDLASMSQVELTMRMGSDQSLYSGWQKAGFKGASRGKAGNEKKKGDGDNNNDDDDDNDNDEKKKKGGGNKIGTMQFSSVKVNLFEGGREARARRSRGGPGSKGQRGAEGVRGRGKLRRGDSAVVTILEGREREGEPKTDSQATESGQQSAGEVTSQTGSRLADATPITGRKGRRSKATGRSQPSRDDKNEFLHALGQSAAGQPTVPMLYFYKYVLKHGEEDGMPQLDKDLFFYIEVQKFKDCSHAFSDEEMMKRKVQSIVDCFLDSVYSPTLQVDITSEMHTKTMKAAQRYLGGKDVTPSLFDEAQFYVFKELLPYWAGFRKSRGIPDQPKKRPVTKYEKMLKKRLETIENYEIPSKDFILPQIPEGAVPSYTISLADGVKYREMTESAGPTPLPDTRDRGSRLTVAPSVENMSRKGRRTSVAKETLVTR
ncbi:LOW QUALITY PROTEIN: uncharacterized protein LOC143295827 [Babylonia areolata]|uniref:LOW QUALITY PROTEIN: uncharacterized protein LOC143295827 n=1 Tax=Babylonia areolata TaxID=304850 RepID=UPI003FD683B5